MLHVACGSWDFTTFVSLLARSVSQKKFTYICYYENDVGIKVNWSFNATALGKRCCDVVLGAIKGLATNASWQGSYENNILSYYIWIHGVKQLLIFLNFLTKDQLVEEERRFTFFFFLFLLLTERTISSLQWFLPAFHRQQKYY